MPSVDVYLYGVTSVQSLTWSRAGGVNEEMNSRSEFRLLCQVCGTQESQDMRQYGLADAPDLEPSPLPQANTTLQPKTETPVAPLKGAGYLEEPGKARCMAWPSEW